MTFNVCFFPKEAEKACMLVLSDNFHVHAWCIKIVISRQGSSEQGYAISYSRKSRKTRKARKTNSPLHQSFLGVFLMFYQGPAPIACKTFWRKMALANVVPGRKKKRRRCIAALWQQTSSQQLSVWVKEFCTVKTAVLHIKKNIHRTSGGRRSNEFQESWLTRFFFTIDLIASDWCRRAMKVIRTADALRNVYSESKHTWNPER